MKKNMLVNSKTCGNEVENEAKKCHKCDKNQKSFFGKTKILTGLVILMVIGTLGSACSNKTNSTTNSATDTKGKANMTITMSEDKKNSKLNYENFVNIKMGSSYEDVKTLLGDVGIEMSSTPTGDGGFVKKYSFTDKGKTEYVTVTITNDKVVNKLQTGLKAASEKKVTLSDYTNIKNGMSYEEVKSILGEPIIYSADNEMLDIGYSGNTDNSLVEVFIQNNKVENKTAQGLK